MLGYVLLRKESEVVSFAAVFWITRNACSKETAYIRELSFLTAAWSAQMAEHQSAV